MICATKHTSAVHVRVRNLGARQQKAARTNTAVRPRHAARQPHDVVEVSMNKVKKEKKGTKKGKARIAGTGFAAMPISGPRRHKSMTTRAKRKPSRTVASDPSESAILKEDRCVDSKMKLTKACYDVQEAQRILV